MKIGFVVDVDSDQPSGIGHTARHLLRRMPCADDELAAFYAKGHRLRIPSRPGMTEHMIPAIHGLPSTLYKSIYFATRQVACDVVHEQANLGFLLPLRSPFKKVVTVHDAIAAQYPEFAHRKYPFVYKKMLHRTIRSADLVVTDTEYIARNLRELFPQTAAEKIRVVYCGYDEERFAPEPQPGETGPAGLENYFLFVSMISPRKNLARVIEALRRARRAQPEITLAIAGNHGWGCEELHRQLPTLKEEGIHYLGYVPDDQLPGLYRNAKALVFPSLYEATGIPILEAMACGTPVITANRTGTAEVAADAALLVDPESTDEIADAMVHMARETALAADLRNAGLKRSAAFSYQKYANELYQLYEEICRG